MSHRFEVRGLNLVESVLRHSPEQLRRFIRRMKALRLNTLIVHYDYGWNRFKDLILEETAQAGVGICLMVFGPRTVFRLSGCKPEWLAKDANGKPWTTKCECDTKPCASCPEALEAYEAGAELLVKALPQAIRRVQLRHADGTRYCECPKCQGVPEDLQWLPFFKASLRAFAKVRPDVAVEYDAYVKRWDVSEGLEAVDRFMFDTFGRQTNVPLGRPSHNPEMLKHLVSKRGADAPTMNEYLGRRLADWARLYPGKPYIHENLMAQGLLSLNGDHAGALLDDLRLCRALGVQGACYEAYEPGFEHFEASIKTLSQGLWDIDSMDGYEPSAFERDLNSGQWDVGWIFCKDQKFPLERHLHDPIVLEHARNYRALLNNANATTLKKLVAHVFAHPKRFDPGWSAFHGCKWCMAEGVIDFSRASEAAQRMLSYHKLWDFMEEVPLDADPRQMVQELVLEAVERAE